MLFCQYSRENTAERRLMGIKKQEREKERQRERKKERKKGRKKRRPVFVYEHKGGGREYSREKTSGN